LFQLQDGGHGKPLPIAEPPEKPPVSVMGEQTSMTRGVGQSKIMDGSELAHAAPLVHACRLTPRVVEGRWEESVF